MSGTYLVCVDAARNMARYYHERPADHVRRVRPGARVGPHRAQRQC